MSQISCHIPPPQSGIDANKVKEPEGERIRAELIEWLTRNKVVSVMLDTKEHVVDIDIVKLPSNIKPVLNHFGSIYINDDEKQTGCKYCEGVSVYICYRCSYLKSLVTHLGKCSYVNLANRWKYLSEEAYEKICNDAIIEEVTDKLDKKDGTNEN